MTVAVGNDGTEPGLQAGRPTTRTPVMSLRRRPRVAAAQLVLLLLGVASLAIPRGGFATSTLLGYPPGSPNPNWVTVRTHYGTPVAWLTAIHATNEARGMDQSSYRLEYPLIPPALLLVAVFLPPAVAGVFRPPVNGRQVRLAWLLAAAGLGCYLVILGRLMLKGGVSYGLPLREPIAVGWSVAGVVMGAVVGWVFGKPPAPTTGPSE